jgi:hypothetical protein
MKKWASRQKDFFAVWRKIRQYLEGEGRQFIPSTFHDRTLGDEESLGTRAMSCGRDIV